MNRYLVVKPVEEVKTNSGVLVPENIDIDTSAFKLVEVLESHTTSQLHAGMRVVARSHMVEEAIFSGKTYYLVTENNVVGIYSEQEL